MGNTITDVQFQPIVGESLLLGALQGKKGGLPDSGRVNVNVAEIGSMWFTIGLAAEIAGKMATSPQFVAPSGKIVVGESAKEARSVARGKATGEGGFGAGASTQQRIALAQLACAGYEVLRWAPEDFEPPRESFPSFGFAPLAQPAGFRLAAAAPWVALAVVGVAAAAAAGLAYWGGKREDGLASVGVEQIKTAAAVNAAMSLAAQSLAAGQPIDPKVLEIIKQAGAGIEASRGWSLPVVAGGAAAVLLAGGAGGAWLASKARSA